MSHSTRRTTRAAARAAATAEADARKRDVLFGTLAVARGRGGAGVVRQAGGGRAEATVAVLVEQPIFNNPRRNKAVADKFAALENKDAALESKLEDQFATLIEEVQTLREELRSFRDAQEKENEDVRNAVARTKNQPGSKKDQKQVRGFKLLGNNKRKHT